ncbi:MAG: GNAT family N-acetyltransferase [Pseudonocardiaceae bacterium]
MGGLELTSLGYRTDLALLRLGGTHVEDRGDHLVVRSPDNPTHRWGNFLLLAQVPTPAASQSWLDRFAAVFPDSEYVALGFDGKDGSVADLCWFSGHGFNAEAQTVMTATEVHEPARLNSDAGYRGLRSDEDWAQSVELRMRCNEREPEPMAYRTYVTAKTQTNRGLVEAGHGGWFGAFIGARLVAQMGLVSAGSDLARFQAVGTDPDHRRRGLAGSLIQHASRYGFGELGARTLVIVADPNCFAIDLYRAVGFAATETQLQVERSPAVARWARCRRHSYT